MDEFYPHSHIQFEQKYVCLPETACFHYLTHINHRKRLNVKIFTQNTFLRSFSHVIVNVVILNTV